VGWICKQDINSLKKRICAVLRAAPYVMSVDCIVAELGDVTRDDVCAAIEAMRKEGIIIDVGNKYGEG